jgi:hypothetical protein
MQAPSDRRMTQTVSPYLSIDCLYIYNSAEKVNLELEALNCKLPAALAVMFDVVIETITALNGVCIVDVDVKLVKSALSKVPDWSLAVPDNVPVGDALIATGKQAATLATVVDSA